MAKPKSAGDKPATKSYYVKPGVAVVNGKKVGDADKVTLTEREAAYDLALGRISEKSFAAEMPAAD